MTTLLLRLLKVRPTEIVCGPQLRLVVLRSYGQLLYTQQMYNPYMMP
eukprot:SAG11_NODE_16687_length_540_cov_1.278912_2_plen_46_part_01